ncbi:MAG: [Clostridia bacterium]|nr:[FeFe] hydrogenase H-cluster radical SAM maturase HydE [Clostridia bacterium]
MNKLLNELGTRPFSAAEYADIVRLYTPETAAALAARADAVRRTHYGNAIFIRGLIEIGNICKNNCLYCGIRRDNAACDRYRLTDEQILACCEEGYALGFRTFVLQGGEDSAFSDARLCALIAAIKAAHPDCAVTLSLGERSHDSYAALRQAGADRYLLRHETADATHYAALHPADMSFDNRMACLQDLRALGYQVGCGFMVGSPEQTAETLGKDLKFIEEFQPEMCGIGPFIPHAATVFADQPAGDVGLTCYLLSVIRLICPRVLLPATTALGTLAEDGRERGIRAGANVVMPNLSPPDVRGKYELYNHKLSTGAESAQQVADLAKRLAAIDYVVVTDRGDYKKEG